MPSVGLGANAKPIFTLGPTSSLPISIRSQLGFEVIFVHLTMLLLFGQNKMKCYSYVFGSGRAGADR